MLLCNIPFFTFKLKNGFATNFVWIFLGWTPTKFIEIRVLPLFSVEFLVILCNF